MTQTVSKDPNQPVTQSAAATDIERVRTFLDANPDFFERHPELLAGLVLSHGKSGATSLLERQVLVLREQNAEIRQRMAEYFDVARENELRSERLMRLAARLAGARTMDQVIDTALAWPRDEYGIEAVGIRLRHPKPIEGRPEFVPANQRAFRVTMARLVRGQPECGEPPEAATLTFLFGSERPDIRSVALMPIEGEHVEGVYALGATDPYRFHAGKGTEHLAQVGAVLASALSRFT